MVSMNFPIQDFGIALAVGALVGIEREKKKTDSGDLGFGGIRTFMLLAEAGAVSAWISERTGSPWVFAVVALCVTLMVLAGYYFHVSRSPQAHGMTTEVAAVVVFLLGGVVLFGQSSLAVVLGIVTAATLAFKEPMHAMVARIDRDDIYAGTKLLIATFIVLPLLPDRAIDPWGAVNPYKTWWLVILISGLSLVGYVATRWLGNERGTTLTGLFGGLVSSTAVSLTFAKRSRDERDMPGSADALAAGIMLAWTVMFVRVLVMAVVLYRPLFSALLVPMSAMAVACLLLAAGLYWRTRVVAHGASAGGVPLKNPFSLKAACKFALFFVAVLVVVKWMQLHASGRGVLGVAALAGLTDVDAITLSMSVFARGGNPLGTAALAVAVATISNTLTKCGLALVLGSSQLKLRLLVSTLAVLAAGAASLLVRM